MTSRQQHDAHQRAVVTSQQQRASDHVEICDGNCIYNCDINETNNTKHTRSQKGGRKKNPDIPKCYTRKIVPFLKNEAIKFDGHTIAGMTGIYDDDKLKKLDSNIVQNKSGIGRSISYVMWVRDFNSNQIYEG